MSGDDGYKFQASLKFGPNGVGMVNVRGDTAEEFEANMATAAAAAGSAAVLVEAYNTEMAGVSAPAPQAPFPSPTFPNQTQTGGGAQACVHGPMTYREGTGNNGPWKGWFCPAQKNDPTKCKTKYVR